jgi:hypothetical protein
MEIAPEYCEKRENQICNSGRKLQKAFLAYFPKMKVG